MKYIEVVTTYKVVGYAEFQVPDSFDENNPRHIDLLVDQAPDVEDTISEIVEMIEINELEVPLLTTPARIEEGAL